MTTISTDGRSSLPKYDGNFYLDPRSKMIIVISSLIIVLYTKNLYVLIGVLILSLLLILIARISFKILIGSLVLFTLFSLIATVMIYFTVSKENPYTTFGIIECRFITSFLFIAWFFYTVDPYELAVSLEKMYFPGKFVWFLTTIYQLVPVLGKEAKTINDVRKIRGLVSEKWNFKRHFYVLKKTLNPLITGAINRGVDLAEVMVVKGFKPKRRKNHILNLRITLFDVLCIIISITSMVLIIVFS
ncbi:MAG: energy-coupling factor transporter transmembrane protein EcfT [Candidatus Heimdallarchaeota archaeon]|nr:energy-coupling factor transporter transmembrane protein EcfT [Candidatus Heimdallarchaeota archaeon]MCK4876310.1 energy-coupling factor transporter transmembrane protein EcfT [Candidatus Heimdallarchaeota archaeon]